jgi:hypothetical protein
VKYLQLFKQGYDPYKVNIKFKKKKKSKSYKRQTGEKNYCYENYVKLLEQQNKKLAMDKMNLKEERDKYKNQLNVKKEEIQRYIRVDVEKDNRILSLENENNELLGELDQCKKHLNLKIEEVNSYKQLDIQKDNRISKLKQEIKELKEKLDRYKKQPKPDTDNNIFLKQKIPEHIDENNSIKTKNTNPMVKDVGYKDQLKDNNLDINDLKLQMQNKNDENKCKILLRILEELNKQHYLNNQITKQDEAISNQSFDINEFKDLIGKIAYSEFKKESQSKHNDTMQKETPVIKSHEDQNFQKINNSNLEVKKSRDIQSKTETDYLYIFVKSVIEIYKNFQVKQKNNNEIIVID